MKVKEIELAILEAKRFIDIATKISVLVARAARRGVDVDGEIVTLTRSSMDLTLALRKMVRS